jgi:uncharacterized SAM-binding protein YcdF (DUF218 family)
MFLFVSKVLGVLLTVSNGLVVVAVVGSLARLAGWRRFGAALTWTALAGFLLIGFGPVGPILMRPLEDRFPRPPDTMPEPTGIIVLGGIVGSPSASRGAIALSQDGERLSETAALAHRYPNAMVVFSGGTFGDPPEFATEAFFAKRFLTDLGVEESRIALETRSLSTAENAAFTRDLVMPQAGERWLLVTSASHVPRAVGSFRRAGFPVIPYPVGYTTTGLPDEYWAIRLEVSTNLVRADVAMHEWLGLIAYRLTGRTDALLPAPDAQQQQ